MILYLFWLGGWLLVGAWLETLGVSILALMGIFLGASLSKFKKPYCWFGFAVSFLFISILLFIRFFPKFSFVIPFSWFVTGRIRFIVITAAVTLGLTASIHNLQNKIEKVSVGILMAIIIVWFCILPFLSPALVKDDLSALENVMDAEGVCYQSMDYTCGPAAAVTALTRLGLQADEGRIAILAHSSPVMGTLPSSLCNALEKLYEDKGLKCHYRYFDSVNQLQHYQLVLVTVKDTFLSDHCVAVIGITDDHVIIADPIDGKRIITRDEFKSMWRCSGIVLEHTPTL
jgi:predicted double-glycine peptidase